MNKKTGPTAIRIAKALLFLHLRCSPVWRAALLVCWFLEIHGSDWRFLAAMSRDRCCPRSGA